MNYANLTEHIIALLADESLPVGLHNAIHEELLELMEGNRANLFHPDVMRVALPLALEREAASEENEREEGASAPVEAAQSTPPAFERCANLIADLLEAEDTPEIIHTLLDNFCTELSNHMAQGYECVCAPETIRQHFASILQRSEARGLVVPRGGVMIRSKGGEA